MKPTFRKRTRPSQLLNGIDLWAFLSFQLVLLIVLMTAPNSPHRGWSVDFARTEHATPMPAALREDAILVTVTRDGNVFFGFNQIRSQDLPLSIHDSLRRGSEHKIYLKVDARARFSDAEVVIDQVRQAGIHDIGIITDQRQPSRR